ncbi:helix-turn-helix domain-containing protein [Flagellimonas algicola]|uniref:Helix-turn-helix transcriptional regulator n=1 Tax=Flagellimonas algicola TaxID=2583815 RepID=A0ABY2WL13_9FLAO|nr:helix-turn-helix transcriptional regulator [Allomuricauda algicola]TMU55529.1 helix-turn-helix transcriptional regulator [Allomuricauda algicola]
MSEQGDHNVDFLRQLANRIKSLRDNRNLTQEDAYNDTGIHFGRIETGRWDPKFSTIRRISEYFELTITEFFAEGFEE